MTVEKFLIAISIVFILSYIASLTVRGPSNNIGSFEFCLVQYAPHFVYLLAASAGAVVMPFMLFYQASATAEKKSKFLWASRFETLVGAVVSEVIMVVILMATVGVDPNSFNLNSVSSLSKGLELRGRRLFANPVRHRDDLCVISCVGGYLARECVGGDRGDRSGSQRFFWIYLLESLPAVAVPMFFPNLFSLLLNSMVAFTFVLIGPGIILGLVASNRKIMGANASSMRLKIGYWASLALIVGFGVFAVLSMY